MQTSGSVGLLRQPRITKRASKIRAKRGLRQPLRRLLFKLLRVQAAISRGAYQKGVAKAGDAKWAAKASGKGSQRFSQGVSDAQQEYANGVAPYLQTIEATALPPRGPKGDPKNIERVITLNNALRAKKLASS